MAALGGDRLPPAPPAQAATSTSSALADAALAGPLGGVCRSQVCQAAQPPWYSSSLTAAGKALCEKCGGHRAASADNGLDVVRIAKNLSLPLYSKSPLPAAAKPGTKGQGEEWAPGKGTGAAGPTPEAGWWLGAGTDVQRPRGGGPGWGVVGVRVRALARGLGECTCTCVHIWVHACVPTRPGAYQRSLALQRGTRLGALPVGLRQV